MTMDNLVERMKMLATGFHGMGDDKQPASKFAHNIIANYCDEAAARIAELTAERDALKARVEKMEAALRDTLPFLERVSGAALMRALAALEEPRHG